ncbi:EVE domain-containing protein [Yangia mangrovi]|uniref:EVE domain-containing protein n=1 Tax=Alloyangia mangrovi TaxID=1779329 RepID=A0ABT2KV22_9RHOB|nr:EVE domain-containing protein [Alloyangia mangrovi]MCT4373258.1 EVE domain-containing protein [Alloyangia mangrovi]
MATWIFQCNPDIFDVDKLLNEGVSVFLFAAKQNAKRMQDGDRFYLWRSQGKGKSVAGVVAKGVLLDRPKVREDDSAGRKYWRDPKNATAQTSRVSVRIDEVANKKGVLQRAWMLDDPILSDLLILKMASGSNYLLEEPHLGRIDSLWENTGVNWSRSQSLAALHVYQYTYGGSLSLRAGQPIPETATLIGRTVKGFYNKVLNFRHIDPRDQRAGFSGAGEVDREVWAEFFDPEANEIRTEALEGEYQRLWGGSSRESRRQEQGKADAAGSGAGSDYQYRPGPAPRIEGYSVIPIQHERWFVYVLALNNKKALKVGYSHAPKSRLSAYNRTIMPEVTGLSWNLAFTHEVPSVKVAELTEQKTLNQFAGKQLPSNGEILMGVDVVEIQLAIIKNSGDAVDEVSAGRGVTEIGEPWRSFI